jgi:hypothetical protein
MTKFWENFWEKLRPKTHYLSSRLAIFWNTSPCRRETFFAIEKKFFRFSIRHDFCQASQSVPFYQELSKTFFLLPSRLVFQVSFVPLRSEFFTLNWGKRALGEEGGDVYRQGYVKVCVKENVCYGERAAGVSHGSELPDIQMVTRCTECSAVNTDKTIFFARAFRAQACQARRKQIWISG